MNGCWRALAAAFVLSAGLAGCGDVRAAQDCWNELGMNAASYTLPPARTPEPGAAFRLHVRAVVPQEHSLVVARADGTVVGSLVPFGPVPEGRVIGGLMSAPPEAGRAPVELRFWLEARDGTCRVLDREALRTVELVRIEVRD
jgi:hypothetical protein